LTEAVKLACRCGK